MKNILSINDLSKKEILDLIFLAEKIKKSPQNYNSKLKNKVLLDIFEKPSLRTRLSFEVAVYQLGGHTIFYDLGNSPLGKGKESIEDTARVISKYVNVVMARLYSQEDLISLAENGNIPVINGLTDYEHPCQILGDLLTIKMSVACPRNMQPLFRINGVEVTQDVNKAIKNADIVYVDSWMSYQISKSKHAKRVKQLRKYQVNVNLMKKSPKALFMHCLPAKRGEEVTSEVMDSNKSIVFDQAENRLHIQKAILLKLLC